MTLRSVVCSFSVLVMVVCLSSCAAEPDLIGLQILPNTQILHAIGETVQLDATGTFQERKHPPRTRNMTNECTWRSSDNGVAKVSPSGLVTAVGSGTATITASYESSTISATAQVTVTTNGAGAIRDLVSLAIIPTTQTVTAVGQTAQYIAIGTFSANPTTDDMTNQVTWSSSAPEVATVNTKGLATAVGQGTATITAKTISPSGATIVGTASFVVTSTVQASRDLVSISIIPSSQPLETTGETAQFLAVGTFSGAPVTAFLTTNASPSVTWGSSAAQVATIDSSGLATAKGKGTSTITASANALNGAAIIGIAGVTAADGPTPTIPLLTIVKLGAGANNGVVVSDPTPINCDQLLTRCSASFPLGSTVTLTATGSVFRAWSSNCTPVSGTPNKCTVPVGVNTVVGAIFD